jgi:hypothetical protein
MLVTEAKVVTVGIGEKTEVLRELPIRLLALETTISAIACLREGGVNMLISQWEHVDCPAGEFLKRVREAKPDMPTIAFVEPGNAEHELMARSLGVSVVLPDDTDDDHFRETVCQVLGLEPVSCLEEDKDGDQVGFDQAPPRNYSSLRAGSDGQ